MKKKLGPLPVWGWAAAVAVGVLIFYWQRHNGSGTGLTSAVNPQPILDPTQGTFDTPSGLSSGGTMPDGSFGTSAGYSPSLAQEISDVQGILTLLPTAPAPGEPQPATSGAQSVQDTVGIISALRDAGLIAPLGDSTPPASTGAAKSKATAHTKSKPPIERVNQKTGKTYITVTNPHGKPNGTYHVYGTGKSKRYVKVKGHK